MVELPCEQPKDPESITSYILQTSAVNSNVPFALPLDRGRDEPCPPPFERGPGHDAMRHGEEEEEQGVDENRDQERVCRPRINRLRDDEIADESDRVQERGEEGEIARHAVDQGD